MRLRRDVNEGQTNPESDDEYEFEAEDSDKPREKRHANNDVQRDVDQLNYKLKYGSK